jgi:hypothetical protein
MTAIARAFSSAIPTISSDFDNLKIVALFCGAGLFVSLLLVSTGLDLSVGFF